MSSATTDLVVAPEATATLFAGASPAEVIAAATEAADELKSVITQRHLFQRIGARDHVLVEGSADRRDHRRRIRRQRWRRRDAAVAAHSQRRPAGANRPRPRAAAQRPRMAGMEGRRRRRRALGRPAIRSFAPATAVSRSDSASPTAPSKTAARSAGAKVAARAPRKTGRAATTTRSPPWRRRAANPARCGSRSGSSCSSAGYATTPAEEVGDGGAGVDQPAPPPDVVAILDEAGIRETAGDLQHVWPNFDAHEFMRILGRRLGGDVPEAVGVALRAWAWWAGKPPKSDGETPQEPPDAPVRHTRRGGHAMSARLTPTAVAEREIARCEKRRARLDDEPISVNAELHRWAQCSPRSTTANPKTTRWRPSDAEL